MEMTPIQARVAYALGRHHGHGWCNGVRAVAIRQLADEGDQAAVATIREMVERREHEGVDSDDAIACWTRGDAGDVTSLGCLLDPTGDEEKLAKALAEYMAPTTDRELADRIGGCSYYAGGWVGLPEPDAEGEVEHTTCTGNTSWRVDDVGGTCIITMDGRDGPAIRMDWRPGSVAEVTVLNSAGDTIGPVRWQRAEGIALALDAAFSPSVAAVRRARGE